MAKKTKPARVARRLDAPVGAAIRLCIPNRMPRLNGDTRRRKKRLRKKLAKLDYARFAPLIEAAAGLMWRRVKDRVENEIFAGTNRKDKPRDE